MKHDRIRDLLARTRVLFATSPIGLGHATRDIAIAEKLKQIVGNDILFITGGVAYELISREGFQALNLYRSPHFTVDAGKLRYRFVWLMRYIIYYKRCKKIAENVIKEMSCKYPVIVTIDMSAYGQDRFLNKFISISSNGNSPLN